MYADRRPSTLHSGVRALPIRYVRRSVYRSGGGFAHGGLSAVSDRRRFLERPSRMRSVLALALAAGVSTCGLAACSRGADRASAGIPRTQTQSTQKHVRHLKGSRNVQDVSGTAPFFSMALALFDAPLSGVTSS